MTTDRAALFRRAGVAAPILVLASAVAAPAAKITLVIADGPNSGFNSTQPVTGVPGNPATTLGQQRQKAFVAAAREWERRLLSKVEIRVNGQWDPMSCTANQGTLASAGPNWVVRDFRDAPRSNTWFVEPLANALAGSDTVRDLLEIDVLFNEDVGEPDCLSGLEWDYAVGRATTLAGTVSLAEVALHELGHGLGFLSTVDHATGEELGGFPDSYAFNLEDHGTGELWPAMTNPERKAAAAATGDLHWVGGRGVLAGQILEGGTHSASGHVLMYAPPVLEEGSSVSHPDASLAASGFDELMEPSATGTAALLVGHRMMQDIGWPADAPTVRVIPDVDGNGFDDLAVVRSDKASGTFSVLVLDSASPRTLARKQFGAGLEPVDLAVVPHFAGTGADELAVLTRDARDGTIAATVIDGDSGQVLQTIAFDPGFVPVALAAVPSFGGSTAGEVALLAWRASDEATRVIIKDASSGAALRTLSFSNGFQPLGIAVVPSFGGGPAAELAILVRRPSTGLNGVYLRDAGSGTILVLGQFAAGFQPVSIAALRNFGGTDASELAVVGQGGAAPQAVVFDASSVATLASVTLDSTLLPVGLTVIPDFAGAAADEIAVVGKRSGDRGVRVLVHDGSTGESLRTIGFPATRSPVAVATVPSIGGDPADDVGVVVTTATDDRLRIFVNDPATGARVRTILVPFDSELGGGSFGPVPPGASAPSGPGAGDAPGATPPSVPLPGPRREGPIERPEPFARY